MKVHVRLPVAALAVLLLIALPPGAQARQSATPAPASTAETASSIQPAAGDWTLTLNARAVAACISLKRFTLPASRIFAPTSFSAALTVPDTDTFQYRGDTFRRVAGTTRYTGSFTFPDDTAARAVFNVLTAATMRGQLVADYRVDTTRCSETVQFEFQQQ